MLGVPQPTVARWESGARAPGAVALALFALLEADPAASRRVLEGRSRA